MLAVALIAGGLAAAIHIWIFVLESIRWEHPATRRIFRMSEADARATRRLALNQGVYNLMLALLVIVGIGLVLAGATAWGVPLLVAGTACMLGAAVFLVASDPRMLRAALVQGVAPAVALAGVVLDALA